MKWLKRILLGITGILLVAFVVIYAGSEYVIHKNHATESRLIVLLDAGYDPAEGERLAQVFGCYRGCHGRHMEGTVAFDEPPFFKAVAPNLKNAIRNYSPEQLETLIRQGVRPEGRSVWGMPSGSFASMTDQHLAAILHFITDYPEHEPETELTDSKFYLGGRVAVLSGMMEAEASIAAGFKPLSMAALDDALTHGQYLAMNVCSECHGIDLEGFEGFTPPLVMAKAYSREQFGRLMSEGIGIGERDLGLMSEVAQMRFSHFEVGEVDDLYDYLQSR